MENTDISMENSVAGGSRFTSTGPSGVPSTLEALEERLIAVHDLWRRSPGEARWPFAGDGPWHLAQGEVGDIKGDYSETLIRTDAGRDLLVRKVESRRPRTALDAREVDERDLVTSWLSLVGVEERRMLWLATEALHRGEGRVPWTALAAWIGWKRTPNRLKQRYREVLGELVCRLNGWPQRRARQLAAGR